MDNKETRLREEVERSNNEETRMHTECAKAHARATAAESALAEARGALKTAFWGERPNLPGMRIKPSTGPQGETYWVCEGPIAALARAGEQEMPLAVVVHCPKCGLQHVDAPEPEKGWTNPPHKSHLCHGCGTIWRPADVPTNGVAATVTRGERDTWPAPAGEPASSGQEVPAASWCGKPGCTEHATPPPGEQGKGGGEGQAPVSVVCDWYSTPHTRNSVCPNPRPAPAQPAEHPASGGEEE